MISLQHLSENIYLGQLFSKRLANQITEEIKLLECNKPNASDKKNQFITYNISNETSVKGIRLNSILHAAYKRLTKDYSEKTGVVLKIPVFPNDGCTVKSQITGQSHEVHTDGGDDDYGMNRILYSSVICLNDDYEGGHTQFHLTGTMDKPNIDIDIKLKAGQALIFNADLNYHGVTEVTAGSRFSLIQFWRE
jgi:predicted 2-oxoglutarate/Fe(II)-dependent dioxygenase YbiX